MAVSYILIRPPQLPELVDPSDAFIVGYDPSTDKTVKIKVANIGGGSVSPPLDISWKSNVEYSSGEIVEYGLRLWKSLQGINEGNFPTEGIWWTEVARGNQSITYWTAGVYTQDPTIKIVNDIFYRLDAALPFESVDFANELASGDWVAIGGGGGGLTPEQLEILEAFRASFSFSGLDRFKQSFSLDLIITSVVIAPNITELRVGKNAATPTDILGQLPLTLSESDTLTLEATYNRESDSYFTLIGKKL